MENETNGAGGAENYPLDDAAIEILAELWQQQTAITVATQSVLSYFLRQHKLQGEWQIAPNRRELVKQPARAMPTAV